MATRVRFRIKRTNDRIEIRLFRGGWPGVMACLKTLLETGEPIEEFAKWPEGV